LNKKFQGKVIRGDGLGRKLGYPTANLNWPPKKRIPKGVFAVRVRVLKKNYPGVAVIGIPTVTDKKPKLEIHILDFDKMIYCQWLSAEIIKKIRNLKTYRSKKELIKMIHNDCRKAKKILINSAKQ